MRSFSPHCQQLLSEIKYRIIKNDTGGYTFRFKYPVSDTIPKSVTMRDLEYQIFTKTVLGNDSLCKCGFNYKLITKAIGKESKNDIRFLNKQHLFTITYFLDLGFNCGGNKCPESLDNYCNEIRFSFDTLRKLVYYNGVHYTFDIEPLYCKSNILKYLESKEKEKKK